MKNVSSAMNPHTQKRKPAISCASEHLHRAFYDGYTADDASVSGSAAADFHDLQKQVLEHLHVVNALVAANNIADGKDGAERHEQLTELNSFLSGMGKSMNEMLRLMEARDRVTEKGSTKKLLDAVYELDETANTDESRRMANQQRATRKRVS